MLRATLPDGRDWIAPLKIRVISDENRRQVGKTKAQVTPELRSEIKSMSLREAVIKVAEDQMNSAISHRTNGFGIYNIARDLNWCGAFAYWCWEQACAIRGDENPFGGDKDVLFSPQKAIHWGIKDTTLGQLLRYAGTSPMDSKGIQEYHETGWNGYNLKPADIVLLREGTASGWKHVCMVHKVNGRSLETIDGNQGMPSIKLVQRNLDQKLGDGSYQLVFLAVIRA